jgi:rhodanese-related sulfurtransferase
MIGTSRGALRLLAGGAVALGLLAPLVGSPYAAEHGAIDVKALARAVAHEQDHVTAIELAQWIKDRRPGLRVVDVRAKADFEAYHIPTAENVSLESLASAGFRPDETVVLYSEGGAHAAQGWVFLRALGLEKVFVLREGLFEWLDRVMNPTIPGDASDEARSEFGRTAALSRYFGGVPQIGAAHTAADAIPPARAATDSAGSAGAVRRVRRRGC